MPPVQRCKMRRVKFKGSGALNESIELDEATIIDRYEIHLSSASGTSEDIELSLDSEDGNEYDVVIDSQDMNTLSDYISSIGYEYQKGDKIKITWTNTDARTWGLYIYLR